MSLAKNERSDEIPFLLNQIVILTMLLLSTSKVIIYILKFLICFHRMELEKNDLAG